MRHRRQNNIDKAVIISTVVSVTLLLVLIVVHNGQRSHRLNLKRKAHNEIVVRHRAEADLRDRLQKMIAPPSPEFVPSVENVPELIEIFADRARRFDTRFLAAGVLGHIGPGASDALPALLATLVEQGGTNEGLGFCILEAAVQIGIDDVHWQTAADRRNIAAAIAPLLQGKSPSTRRLAAGRLCHLDDGAWPFIEQIAALLKDDDFMTRQSVAIGLRFIGKPAVPFLAKALRHDDAVVSVSAADSLRHIGPDAASAVPDLIQALNDNRSYRTGDAVRIVVTDLRNDVAVREVAAIALGIIGSSARDALPVLTRMQSDPNESIAREAAKAAGLIAVNQVESIE